MRANADITKLMEAQGNLEGEIRVVKTEIGNISKQVSGMDHRLDKIETETQSGFMRLYDKFDKLANRPWPWSILLGVAGLIVTIGVAMLGAILTVVLGLAAWLNTYMGTMIDKTDMKLSTRLDAIERRIDHAADEKSAAQSVRDP